MFWLALAPLKFSLQGLTDAYERIPLLRAGMISLAILLGVGTIINDSGIVVPAVGILFLVPVLAHLETFETKWPVTDADRSDDEGAPQAVESPKSEL